MSWCCCRPTRSRGIHWGSCRRWRFWRQSLPRCEQPPLRWRERLRRRHSRELRCWRLLLPRWRRLSRRPSAAAVCRQPWMRELQQRWQPTHMVGLAPLAARRRSWPPLTHWGRLRCWVAHGSGSTRWRRRFCRRRHLQQLMQQPAPQWPAPFGAATLSRPPLPRRAMGRALRSDPAPVWAAPRVQVPNPRPEWPPPPLLLRCTATCGCGVLEAMARHRARAVVVLPLGRWHHLPRCGCCSPAPMRQRQVAARRMPQPSHANRR